MPAPQPFSLLPVLVLHNQTTVDVYGLTVDPRCRVGAQVCYELSHLVICSVTPYRCCLGHLLPCIRIDQIVHSVSVDCTWADAIHVHAIRPELLGHSLGHCHLCETPRAIGKSIGSAPLTGPRRHVDYLGELYAMLPTRLSSPDTGAACRASP